ncbi:MAG TPA: hypothetical protein VKJ65_08750 [Phycisphaerae bacterium]|nr:hypothetical protein [Phycisphaerae bacterium]
MDRADGIDAAGLSLVQKENRPTNGSADSKNDQHDNNDRIHSLPLLVGLQMREK